jgi:hypothetical protein
MKLYIFSFFVLLVLNIIITGVLQSSIKRTGNEMKVIEGQYAANLVVHSNFVREKQELLRRDRIIQYAQQNLGMQLLKPDQIAGGTIIKEIQEDVLKNNETKYRMIDSFTPMMASGK